MKGKLSKKLLAMLLAVMLMIGFGGNTLIQAFAAAPVSYTNIYAGQSKYVSISSSGNSVYFQFVPQVSGNYTFRTSEYSGDPYLYLLDNSGNTLTRHDDIDVDDNRNALITYNCIANTVYYIRCTMYSSKTGSYMFSVNCNSTNGTTSLLVPAKYTNIYSGQSKYVSINTNEGSVYFQFVPQASDNYSFATSDCTGDPYIYLLDENGNQLVADDDGGANHNSMITYYCMANTVYYVRCAIYSTPTGIYTLAVDRDSTIGTVTGTTVALFNSGKTGDAIGNDSTNTAVGSFTNNGYDIYSSANSSSERVRLGLSFTVPSQVTELSYLTIKAYDVDESSGERDLIYLVDATTGTKTQLSGYLSGRNNEWNDTTFRIDPSLFTVGHRYYFELYESVSGWVVYVRNVDIQLGIAEVGQITYSAFSASISAAGRVETTLSLTSKSTSVYYLEYAATSNGYQYGSSLNQSITVTPNGATKTVAFQLDNNAPEGNYQIDVTVRDSNNRVVATCSVTTSGPENSTVNYDANGGSNNLPIDYNVYRRGDTVEVLFNYVPAKAGYIFKGWSRNANATVPEFTATGNTTFTIGSDDVTLYAVWADAHPTCTPGGWIVDYAPTTVTDGQRHTECTVCGAIQQTQSIPRLAIITQPTDVFAPNGTLAMVEMNVQGEELTYTWYVKNPGESSFKKSSVVDGYYDYTMTTAKSGRQVYCVITDKYGNSVTTNTVTIRMSVGIKTQPKDAFAAVGTEVSTKVVATGEGLSYQWYVKNPGATKFTKSSVTTATYSYEMTDSKSGRQVYCVITDKYGNSVTTKTVTLRKALRIKTQPTDVFVQNGKLAMVEMDVEGDGLTYTWYVKNPGETSFKKSSVVDGYYDYTMTTAKSGRQVYCVIRDMYGNSVVTDTVTITMSATIKTQPKDTYVAIGDKAIVKVNALGDGLKYTWYYAEAGSNTFKKTTTFTSDSYSVTMSESRSGRRVYCVVTDVYGNFVKTDVVTLGSHVAITTQPTDAVAKIGNDAVTSVKATGEGLTYVWYYKNPTMKAFAKSSVTTDTYYFEMSASKAGRQVYCVVTDKYGNSVVTDTVTLYAPVSVKTQPTNVKVNSGEKANVTFEAAGADLTYTWYYAEAGSNTFKKTTTFKGNSYSVTMSEARSGRRVYCVVTDKFGNTVKTNIVTLSMK